MNNRIFSFVLAGLASCSAPVEIVSGSERGSDVNSSKPNIIVIMTDQQSYNTISALAKYNRESKYFSTPNIDRIVEQGTAFIETYCANPVSVPSRFALFTGKYGGEFSIRENLCSGAKEEVVRPFVEQNGMGHVFSRAGYETVYAGKVHLPCSGKSGMGMFSAPVSYGFETYLTKDERAEMGRISGEYLAKYDNYDKPLLFVASFLNPHDICLEGSTNLSEKVEERKGKPEIAATVRMMRERAAQIPEDEFYGDVAPQLPYNFEITENYPETKCRQKRFLDLPENYWRKYRWIYAELVKLVDDHIGDVLDGIDANPKLKENSIIVFTSDHGEMQGAHQSMTKSLPFEECEKVPFIFAGRGIEKGKIIKDFAAINGIDLMPTICELAGIDCPDTDGVSLAGCLLNGEKIERDYVYIESETFVNIIKDGFKYTYFDGDNRKEMLVNLKKDYGEEKNVISEYPQKAAEFRAIAEKHVAKAPAPKKIKKKKNK